MARQIESGMVWINDHSFTRTARCQCSWGGVKDSGLGRSHSKFGFYECVNIKLVAWEPGLTRDFWWQPYDDDLGDGACAPRPASSTAAAPPGRGLREGPCRSRKVGAKIIRKGR